MIIILGLNAILVICSMYLVLSDFKMMSRNIIMTYIKDDNNYLKKNVLEQVQREKIGKFRWMKIKKSIRIVNL